MKYFPEVEHEYICIGYDMSNLFNVRCEKHDIFLYNELKSQPSNLRKPNDSRSQIVRSRPCIIESVFSRARAVRRHRIVFALATKEQRFWMNYCLESWRSKHLIRPKRVLRPHWNLRSVRWSHIWHSMDCRFRAADASVCPVFSQKTTRQRRTVRTGKMWHDLQQQPTISVCFVVKWKRIMWPITCIIIVCSLYVP